MKREKHLENFGTSDVLKVASKTRWKNLNKDQNKNWTCESREPLAQLHVSYLETQYVSRHVPCISKSGLGRSFRKLSSEAVLPDWVINIALCSWLVSYLQLKCCQAESRNFISCGNIWFLVDCVEAVRNYASKAKSLCVFSENLTVATDFRNLFFLTQNPFGRIELTQPTLGTPSLPLAQEMMHKTQLMMPICLINWAQNHWYSSQSVHKQVQIWPQVANFGLLRDRRKKFPCLAKFDGGHTKAKFVEKTSLGLMSRVTCVVCFLRLSVSKTSLILATTFTSLHAHSNSLTLNK